MFYKSISPWWIGNKNKLVLHHRWCEKHWFRPTKAHTCVPLYSLWSATWSQLPLEGQNILLDANIPAAGKGLLCCLGMKGGRPVLEIALLCWGQLVKKALTPINASKLSFTSELAESGAEREKQKALLPCKSVPMRKSSAWNKLNSHFPRLSIRVLRSRGTMLQRSLWKQGWLKGACVSPWLAGSVEAHFINPFGLLFG